MKNCEIIILNCCKAIEILNKLKKFKHILSTCLKIKFSSRVFLLIITIPLPFCLGVISLKISS